MEVGGDILNFLDITLIKRNGGLIFNLYKKPTFSNRFLNFYFHHPPLHKRGTIISLIDIIFLSYSEFQKENFDYIIKILIESGYPLDFIFKTVIPRIHFKYCHQNFPNTKELNKSKTLPFSLFRTFF